MKNSYRLGIMVLSMFLASPLALADNPLGQVIQISTQFRAFVGKPTWLLIVRDVDTGLVSPYVFDIRNNENYWVAFTYGHNYRITVSNLKFGTYGQVSNFCGLENVILSASSMFMTLTGVLTPDPKTIKCYVHKYKDANFTIVKQQ
jgi:hypothetical protein